MLNTQGLPVWKKILQCLNFRHHQMLIAEGLYDMMNNHIFQTTLGLGFIFLQCLNSCWVPVLRNGLLCPWLSWEGGIWPPWLTFLLLWKQGRERGSLLGWAASRGCVSELCNCQQPWLLLLLPQEENTESALVLGWKKEALAEYFIDWAVSLLAYVMIFLQVTREGLSYLISTE